MYTYIYIHKYIQRERHTTDTYAQILCKYIHRYGQIDRSLFTMLMATPSLRGVPAYDDEFATATLQRGEVNPRLFRLFKARRVWLQLQYLMYFVGQKDLKPKRWFPVYPSFHNKIAGSWQLPVIRGKNPLLLTPKDPKTTESQPSVGAELHPEAVRSHRFWGDQQQVQLLSTSLQLRFQPLENKITQYRTLIQKYGSNEYNIVLETPAPLVFVPPRTLRFKTKIHTHPTRESRACSHLVGIFFSPRICLTNPKLGKWDLTTLSVLIAG